MKLLCISLLVLLGHQALTKPQSLNNQPSILNHVPAEKIKGCGGVYTTSNGVIKHPSGDGNYGINEYCEWKINADVPLQITFDSFDLEDSYDFLYIRDGDNSGSNEIAELTGDTLPGPYETSGNSAYLQFTSDSIVIHPGFELHWAPASLDTTCQCGVTNANRIIGGTEVNPIHKYPWQVGLVQPDFYIMCGGTIINDRWILTAAHCLIDKKTCKLEFDASSGLQVLVGEHHQFDESDDISDTKKYNIKTFIVHDNYSCEPDKDYDFALLELTEAIPFNSVIRPICLPEDDTNTNAGRTGIVTGWGAINKKGDQLSEFLRVVEVPILDNDDCMNWGSLPPWKMCAGGGSDKDSCGGDSGGPMYVIENGKHVQVGVVSYGPDDCASPNWPGVYARVSYVLPWIAENTSNGKQCN